VEDVLDELLLALALQQPRDAGEPEEPEEPERRDGTEAGDRAQQVDPTATPHEVLTARVGSSEGEAKSRRKMPQMRLS
jgi:hypothetical protein